MERQFSSSADSAEDFRASAAADTELPWIGSTKNSGLSARCCLLQLLKPVRVTTD